MDLVIWTYIFGGATLFGVIVGLFSVWNGRMTRRDVNQLIVSEGEQTRKLIDSSSGQTRELLSAMHATQGAGTDTGAHGEFAGGARANS